MDPSAQENTPAQGHTREVDPNRLVERDFCLGYEKSSGFETVTNFKISVAGYVSEDDRGLPVGFILNAHLERFGDDNAHQNHQKYVFIDIFLSFLFFPEVYRCLVARPPNTHFSQQSGLHFIN